MFRLVDLTNKKIVVAGASKGIGKGVAVMLSKLGAQIVLLARGEDDLKVAINSLEGTGHRYYVVDLSDLESIEDCIKKIVADVGMLDGLVYCAGIGTSRPLQQFKPEAVDRIIKINLEGFIEIVRCVTKKKRFNPGMRIVGISSVASTRGDKSHTVYSASKAGMDAAVRCIACEVAEKGICINTVAPSMVKTDMYDRYISNTGEDGENKDLLRRQYLGLGKVEDVAGAVAFLISSAARFITGICLPVDGGMSTN